MLKRFQVSALSFMYQAFETWPRQALLVDPLWADANKQSGLWPATHLCIQMLGLKGDQVDLLTLLVLSCDV